MSYNIEIYYKQLASRVSTAFTPDSDQGDSRLATFTIYSTLVFV